MTDQQTQWQHCHEEANRLRRELKALNTNRATLTDPEEIKARVSQIKAQIEELYDRVDIYLSKSDKLEILVQRIYSQYKGLGVIDDIRDMKIEGVKDARQYTIPIKEEQPYYINILAIKKWMEENNTTKPPNASGRDDISKEEIRDIVKQSGIWAPLVYILVSFLQVTFVPLPGAVTILAGSYLFGFWASFLYSYSTNSSISLKLLLKLSIPITN